MSPPLVSVLLPFRNNGATLELALRSVLAEGDVPIEIIAVDDGSTDESGAVLRRVAERDPRVRTLATGGVGIVGALSSGLDAARGKWIARMDGDDESLPGRWRAQIDALERDERLGVIGTRVEAFPAECVLGGMQRYVTWLNATVSADDHAREMFVESPLCHPSVMLRREALLSVGAWRECMWAEDYDLWLRLDAAGWRLAKVPEVFLRWRQGSGRLTFADPRYARDRFLEAKGHYLAPRLIRLARTVVVWGAGPVGRRLARALERGGVRASAFVDVDPRKIGRVARGVRIVAADALVRGGPRPYVVVAVGSLGARALIRSALVQLGYRETDDFVCAA